MTLSEYFALAHGNQVALAAALGSHQPTVRQWAVGERPIPVVHGAAIERATGGAVTRQELFPDTWASIWPELASAAPTAGADEPLRARMLELAGEVTMAREQAAADGAERARQREVSADLRHKLLAAEARNFELERQVLALFGPAVAPADHGAEVRTAIAQTRLVFEGDPVAVDVLAYLESVLAAGAAGAPVPAQTGIEPGAEDASIAKEAQTPLCSAPTLVAGSEWPAWARQLDKVTVDVERIAGYAGDVVREMANILGTVGADAFDQAAAAMAAESAQKVAEAERAGVFRDTRPRIDESSTPTIVSRLVVEVDTTQLDAALAKAERLRVLLAGLALGGASS